MALIDDYAASLDPRVVAQVQAAIYQVAQSVYTEGTGVTGHTTRAAFATKIVTGQEQFQPLILSACSFANLSAASTDTTVTNAVSALWNMWAGV
jgi:hypothetical protein